MDVTTAPQHGLQTLGRGVLRALQRWWGLLHFLAVALVLILTPSSYERVQRRAMAQQIHASTWQVLWWFTVLCSLISLVLIRIVVVTALSYGLSQYALEMVVRVLVLELIPLGAALFVVLRADWPTDPLHPDQGAGGLAHLTSAELLQHMRHDWVPQILATAFSVVTLALMSGVISLVLAYLAVYGLSPWGFVEYTRVVGRVLAPPVALAFAMKTFLFSLAVAVIPLASALQERKATAMGTAAVAPGTVRLFVVLLVIEGVSLAIKYI